VEEKDGGLAIVDGEVWVTDQDPSKLDFKILRPHVLADRKGGAVTGVLDPRTEKRSPRVVRRRVPDRLDRAVVVRKPVSAVPGAWSVTVTQLDPSANIGRPRLEYHFFLATSAADRGALDEMKTVGERSILIAPRPGQALFRSWAVDQRTVSVPQIGHILSGTELRWYVAAADRCAEYLVTDVSVVRTTIQVCAHSSTPRDCRDDWCGIKHSQKPMVIEAGLDIKARRIAGVPGSGSLKLLEDGIEIFRSRDRDYSDDCEGASLHIGGTADGYVFTP